MDAGDQFFAVEWLGDVIICPMAKAAQFVFRVIVSRHNQSRRIDPR